MEGKEVWVKGKIIKNSNNFCVQIPVEPAGNVYIPLEYVEFIFHSWLEGPFLDRAEDKIHALFPELRKADNE